MRFLVIGLGSMGKRRIRCLKALQHSEIAGFDPRADRRAETEKQYGAKIFESFETAMAEFKPTALLICVPPDLHHIYMRAAVQAKLPFFVEASVVDTGMAEIIAEVQRAGITACPSATLTFHPALKKIREIVQSGELGTISNILLHSGQYLPDWHTYEKVSDYYVSNPATGGAREILPFELTWLTAMLGFPKRVTGFFRKTIEIEGAPKIEDTYNALFDYGGSILNLTVDVVSRYATRRLVINAERAQLVWTWDQPVIKIYRPEKDSWDEIKFELEKAAVGYNPNITEGMYIDEVAAFVESIRTGVVQGNTLENDHRILKLLYLIESSDREGRILPVDF